LIKFTAVALRIFLHIQSQIFYYLKKGSRDDAFHFMLHNSF